MADIKPKEGTSKDPEKVISGSILFVGEEDPGSIEHTRFVILSWIVKYLDDLGLKPITMVFPWIGDGGNNRGKTENKFKDATGVTKIEFIQRSRQPSIQKLLATRDPKLSAPDVEQVLVLVTTEEGPLLISGQLRKNISRHSTQEQIILVCFNYGRKKILENTPDKILPMQNFEGNSALVNHFCLFFPD